LEIDRSTSAPHDSRACRVSALFYKRVHTSALLIRQLAGVVHVASLGASFESGCALSKVDCPLSGRLKTSGTNHSEEERRPPVKLLIRHGLSTALAWQPHCSVFAVRAYPRSVCAT